MAAILAYIPFRDKLGSAALKCGQIFDKLFPEKQTTHDIDNALATMLEARDILEDLEKRLREARIWAENIEKREHLT